jgi:hypothetical protein
MSIWQSGPLPELTERVRLVGKHNDDLARAGGHAQDAGDLPRDLRPRHPFPIAAEATPRRRPLLGAVADTFEAITCSKRSIGLDHARVASKRDGGAAVLAAAGKLSSLLSRGSFLAFRYGFKECASFALPE